MTDIYDDFPIKYSIYDQQSAINLIQQKNNPYEELGYVYSLADLAKILSPIKDYNEKYFVLKKEGEQASFHNIDQTYLCQIFQDICNYIQSGKFSGYVNNIEHIIIENSFIIE
ncbi:hypothetical protein [Apilactobacillus timberlakei]|uniref:hypothetical protein n=1 Tax=Apilactobacillus timberlakei TaxID=2008380 RepID=UPI0011299A71|nr:hypothetical protein [Apilactobacillus timberlakei]TPR16272.1 hypothetical protein DYZ95_07850 [Apilactobacillus timberlakei]TPR21557.1 hypothetical protein DY083_05920 [Apilactobacillus timberlakei]